MYDPELLVEKLKTLLEALERIPRRFADIATPDDFYASDAGIDRMDAMQLFDICRNDIPTLIETVKTMIEDIGHGPT